MNALKINNLVFNPNPESGKGLFIQTAKISHKALIFSYFLFNSNSETAFTYFIRCL